MISIPYIKDFFDVVKKTSIDDVVDRLCYFFTTLMFVIFALMTGSKQLFGEPIECIMPPEFPDSWVRYARQYCYVSSTYFVPFDKTWNDVERQNHTVEGYYQWVPFILVAQAILMYLPHLTWKRAQSYQTINFEHVVTQAENLRYVVSEKRQEGIHDIVQYIQHRLSYQGTNKKHLSYAGFGTKSTFFHMMSKVFTIGVILMQLIFMNQYFGRGHDNYWGFTMVYNALTNVYWEESGVFPRVTFCDFNQPALGTENTRTVQCVLMVNMLNEKIFVAAWLWLAALLVICISNLIYSAVVLYTPQFRRTIARKYLRPLVNYGSISASTSSYTTSLYDNSKIAAFADETLGADGVHLFQFITNHAGALIASQICCALYDALNFPEGHPRLETPFGPAGNADSTYGNGYGGETEPVKAAL
uniref:Innexin n=1 Tax=Panagrellus redivivus TaxID=6233 RepID=A0A7E4V9U9_PANRE